MIRRTLVTCAAVSLAVFIVMRPVAPHAQGQQGGLPAVSAQVQALQMQVANLSAALSALSAQAGRGNAALQAQITALGTQLTGVQQLLDQFNVALNTASGNVANLQARVTALEQQVSALGLRSYDQLAGLPCTTAIGTQSTVKLVGFLKTPICADGRLFSTNGRFVDFGLVVGDTQTNLMWEKKDQAAGLHDVANTYNWCHATGNSAVFCTGNTTSWIGQVNAEVFAGFSNWRVPTRDELLGIVDASVATCGSGPPCIDPIFGPTQALVYWSSTEDKIATAWFVHFNGGSTSSVTKALAFSVRAVRTGP